MAFTILSLAATPLWWTYTHLASRFDVGVGVGDSGSKLGSPLEIARYLRATFGDLTAGWPIVAYPLAVIALIGLVSLARTRLNTAFLTVTVGVVPAAALLAVRSGSGPSRAQAREDAAAWLAATTRPSDVPFAYTPLYLDAWHAGAPLESLFVHRGDPAITLTTLEEASKPLGRGLWVLDASDEPDASEARLHIPEVVPSSAFESRAFGPFLIVRSTDPVDTVLRFLEATVAVQRLGQSLDVSDSWNSLDTALTALEIGEARKK